jgi:hypothetical protein
MITFNCLWCSQQFTAPDNMAGKRIKCRSCGSPVDIPRPGAQAAEAAPPATAQPAYHSQGSETNPFATLQTASAGEEYEPLRRGGSTLPGMLVALLGSLMLGAGVFLPAVNVPDTGKFTFWQLGTGLVTRELLKENQIDLGASKLEDKHLSVAGAIVVGAAGLAFFCALARSSGMLWFMVLVAIGGMGYLVGHMQYLIHQVKSQPENLPAGNFSLGLPIAQLPQVRYQLGGGVMIAGILFLIVGAILISSARSRRRYY